MSAAALHARLRLSTRAVHEALEQVTAARRFFDSLPAYMEYLRRFAAFQACAEWRLTECDAGTVIADWPMRQRAHLALRDLECLQGNAQTLSPTSDRLLLTPRPEHVLGVAYVLEGSTLGGAVVLRSLAPLGVTAEHGGSFLSGYGDARGRMWQGYLRTLAEWDARGVDHGEVVRAALSAFETAGLYLAQTPTIAVNSREPALLPASR